MRVALDLVKAGAADACVSAGNTGALMATSRFVLKMLPGIDRPAICTSLPSASSHTWVLDLGANVDCEAKHLFQFALMGSVLASAVDGNANPSVGLLNVGEEEIKGNDAVKRAAQLLADGPFNYAGFAEGDDIYMGNFDVIVCDGFVGNIALKTSEGVARMIATFIKQGFRRRVRHPTGSCGAAACRNRDRRASPGAGCQCCPTSPRRPGARRGWNTATAGPSHWIWMPEPESMAFVIGIGKFGKFHQFIRQHHRLH